MAKNDIALNIYFKEIQNHKILPKKILTQYVYAYQKYEDPYAKFIIVVVSQSYVYKIALNYLNTDKFSLNDLISEGNIGLMDAIDNFDVNSGNHFLTFATDRIKKQIRIYLKDFASDVHIPHNVIHNYFYINKIVDKYYTQNAVFPPMEYLIENSNLTLSQIKKVLYFKNTINDNINKIYVDDDIVIENYDVNKTNNIEKQTKQDSLSIELNIILDKLVDVNTKEIIYDFFGINTKKLITIELEKKYQTSISNIKNIVNKGITNIKNNKEAISMLQKFL